MQEEELRQKLHDLQQKHDSLQKEWKLYPERSWQRKRIKQLQRDIRLQMYPLKRKLGLKPINRSKQRESILIKMRNFL